MSASAPWSVKGIDAKAREVAKDLARRSGMTLGEWLNQMILEGEDVGAMINRERERSESYAEAPAPLARRRPSSYRETQNDIHEARPASRPAAFSSGARPLAAREISSADLRRRSIFDDRPRYDEEADYGAASNEMGRVARALESLSSRIEGSETRSASAVRGVSTAVESLLGRMERTEAAQTETQERLQGRLEERTNDILSSFERHEESREELAARLEQAERLIDAQAERLEGLSGHLREEREHIARVETQLKSPQVHETVRAVEGALGKLANQLYEGEQRHRDVVKDVREDMVGLSHRLTQMELRDPERAAQGLIDKVVARMAQRLEQAEAQTSGAIKALEQAFTTLDARLGRVEERGDVTDPESVQSLKHLANDLSRRVEDSRTELLNALQDRTSATSEQLLSALSERVEQSEKRSAEAIERLGQDVLRIAESINRRVSTVESAQVDGFERLGGEVRQVNEGIEARFGRTESAHAQALERLGGEIARISERLTLRLAETERRAAQAVEGVGGMIEQQRDQTRSELADRIRQSEDRTAKMLEEARARIDHKLAQVRTQSLLSESGLHGTARPSVRGVPTDLPNPFVSDFVPTPQVQFDDDEPQRHATAEKAVAAEPVRTADLDHEPEDDVVELTEPPRPTVESVTAGYSPAERVTPGFTPAFDPFLADDLEYDLVPLTADNMIPSAAPKAPTTDDEDDSDPFAGVEVSRKTAPKAASQAAVFASPRATYELEDEFDGDDVSGRPAPREFALAGDEAGVSVSTRDALAAARAAVRASMEGAYDDRKNSPLGGLKPGAARTRGAAPTAGRGGKPNTFMTAFTASAIAAVVVGAGVGALVLANKDGATGTGNKGATPFAATAVMAPESHDPNLLKAKFISASQLLDARAPGAVAKMEEIANQGYAPAQYRMAQIYSGLGNYVPKDDHAARLWTQRAADGGVSRAMYDLGTMYYNGIGGPQNQVTAAMYFRKSAQYGISSGQYNIGILLSGNGPQNIVVLNPTEAYKWLSLAAKDGSNKEYAAQAAAQAESVSKQLTEEQRRTADEAVATFVPTDDGYGEASSGPPLG